MNVALTDAARRKLHPCILRVLVVARIRAICSATGSPTLESVRCAAFGWAGECAQVSRQGAGVQQVLAYPGVGQYLVGVDPKLALNGTACGDCVLNRERFRIVL